MLFSPRARFNGVKPRGRGYGLGGEMARRVRPSSEVIPATVPATYMSRTCI